VQKGARMRSFRSIYLAGLVLWAAGCGSDPAPAPGTVLSSEAFAMPAGATLAQACGALCLADAGLGCSECQAQSLSDGGPGLLCEKVECGPPATGHE
jgi:hypothetical protein